MNKNNKGFSLIELMIVVAIIGIITAIAVPSYSDYVRNANRTDAMTELMTFASNLEREKVLISSYGADATDAAYETPTEHFKFTITRTASTFTLSAIAKTDAQKQDSDCQTLTINHLGQQQSYANITGTGTATTTCW